MYLDIGFRIWEPNHHTSTVKKLILEPVSAHITGLVVIVSRVINDRRKLVLGELPELSLQLHVEGDDGENQEDHHQARHCSSQTKVLCFRKITPVALTHPLLPPVDVAVVLELAVPEPGPKQRHQHDLPHNPEHHDLLAVLLCSPNETKVCQQADDGRYKGRAYILPVRFVCPLRCCWEGVSEEEEEAAPDPTHGGEEQQRPQAHAVVLQANQAARHLR